MLRTLCLRRSFHHHQTLTSATDCSTVKSTATRILPNSNRTFCTSPAPSSSTEAKVRKYLGYGALMIFCGATTYYYFPKDAMQKKAPLFLYAPMPKDLHAVSNWSGTHEVLTREFHQPEKLAELEKLVEESNEKMAKIRPVGSGRSPNGIGLAKAGMVNLELMDKVLEVDKEKKKGESAGRDQGAAVGRWD